jgi:hypothetical protein
MVANLVGHHAARRKGVVPHCWHWRIRLGGQVATVSQTHSREGVRFRLRSEKPQEPVAESCCKRPPLPIATALSFAATVCNSPGLFCNRESPVTRQRPERHGSIPANTGRTQAGADSIGSAPVSSHRSNAAHGWRPHRANARWQRGQFPQFVSAGHCCRPVSSSLHDSRRTNTPLRTVNRQNAEQIGTPATAC